MGGVRGGADSEWGGLLPGHRKRQPPTLWPMPAGARFGPVEGRGDTFLKTSPMSEESKPPGSWPTPLEFPRSFFFPKTSDSGTTSLAGHKTVLITGGVFQVPFANRIPHLPPAPVRNQEALQRFGWIPKRASPNSITGHLGSVNAMAKLSFAPFRVPTASTPPHLASFYLRPELLDITAALGFWGLEDG